MSATEDDTELTDLLIQNLENTGVLNKLKAEMRAAVFLAMEEQDKLENKTPLINENLRKCLNTKEGRLAASLVVDFLQVFNLDFTLAVFQPEINSMSGLDGRELICRQMSLSPSELNNNCPLLLELVRGGRHKMAEDSVCNDDLQQRISNHSEASDIRASSSSLKAEPLDLEDHEDGDSFFDDPLPKPQKTYGSFPVGEKDRSEKTTAQKDVVPLGEECLSGPGASPMRRGRSLSDLSVLAVHSEDERDDGLSERSETSEPRKTETSQSRENPAGAAGGAGGAGGGGGGGGGQSHSGNDDDVEYDDDFNSHRSDFSRSEISIGEEIEEVSIEGPETSDKLDETTQDLSVSQISRSHGADYMEAVP
ncbi:centrosomal protein 43 isoform X1 [Brachionichthys hirsutus]|uniref:centrosomal protein 43 isoform X1 n=1 Tax=Brachionichthys hirsutus TaxID=412623 RepID=UPI0036052785